MFVKNTHTICKLMMLTYDKFYVIIMKLHVHESFVKPLRPLSLALSLSFSLSRNILVNWRNNLGFANDWSINFFFFGGGIIIQSVIHHWFTHLNLIKLLRMFLACTLDLSCPNSSYKSHHTRIIEKLMKMNCFKK